MTPDVGPVQAAREIWRYNLRPLHVFTLCGFAFTVPILRALARQAVYIHDQDFGWTEIAALLFGLAICLPLGFLLADRVALGLSKRLRGWGRNSVLFTLFVLLLLSIIRPYASGPWIEFSGFAGYLTVLLSLMGAATAVWLYEKFRVMRLGSTFFAVGLVVYPAVFLCQFNSMRQSAIKADEPIVAQHPVPVVMVVFDEFSGTTLLNDRMEIDARRFPQFARLAQMGTFYRNATTVHPRTICAIPALLTGRFPEKELPPLASNYPGNVFQTIRSTGQYDMTVFEPTTRLNASRDRRHKSQKTALQKTDGLVRTLSTIYLRLILTQDIPIVPGVPREWSPVEKADTEVQLTSGSEVFRYPQVGNRPEQLAHFLTCVKSSDRPRFTFMHVVLPHMPWVYFATGEQYVQETSFDHPAGAVGIFSEDWLKDPSTIARNEFRYRQQVGFVDLFLGRLLDRLSETQVLDKCLLIVTADHGVSFRPGHSRRVPDAESLADIASVPLFIKLPGQKLGRVDDRNVESIDVFPTIAETLGIELPEPVDGIPVSQTRRRLRKTLYYEKTMTVIEPDLPQRRAAVMRQFNVFGHDDLDHLPASIPTHPEWHGRKLSSFAVGREPVEATLYDPPRDRSQGERYSRRPSAEISPFLKGKFETRELPQTPAELVVTVDGVVCDSGRTFPMYGNQQGFEFLLPRSVLPNASHDVRVLLVDRSKATPTLRPVTVGGENLAREAE